MKAFQKGRDLRRRLQIHGEGDLEDVATRMGLQLVPWSPLQEVDEVKLGTMVGVSTRLSQPRRRWAIAHAIGHHLLHPGNHLWLRAHTMLAISYERQAEEFAFGLLVDRREAGELGFIELWDVAGFFGVPEDVLAARGWQCGLL